MGWLMLILLFGPAFCQAGLRNISWCKEFDWTGEDVKAVDDCDIFNDQLSVKVSRLTNKSECIEVHSLKVGELEREMKYNMKGEAQNVVNFTNKLSAAEAKEQVTILYIAWLDNPIRNFKTSFNLDARSCLINSNRNGKNITKDDPTTKSSDTKILPYITAILLTAILCSALVATVYLVFRMKKEVKYKCESVCCARTS